MNKPPYSTEILDDSKESSSFLKTTSKEFRETLTGVFLEPIVLDESWHFSDHPLSPTFGDPMVTSSETGITYKDAALAYMETIKEKKSSWLPEAWQHLISEEIKEAHDKRCDQSKLSLDRMRLIAEIQGPEIFTETIQNQLHDERSGQAVTIDRVKLLTEYTAALALEDIKNTGCMLDIKMHNSICEMYMGQLSKLTEYGVEVAFYDGPGDFTKVDASYSEKGILIVKKRVAKLTYNGVDLDAVLRTNYIMLPPDLETPEGYIKNLRTINGEGVDLQPLFLSGYLHFLGFNDWFSSSEDELPKKVLGQ